MNEYVIRAFTAAQRIACVLPTAFLRFDPEPGTIAPGITDRTKPGKSTIPGAGNGLFCRKEIKRNEIICSVKGRKHSLFACFFFVRDFSHVFTLSSWFVLVPDSDDVVQLANHHFDDAAINAVFLRDPKNASIELIALRDIRAGEEVFVTYHERHLKSQSWARSILKGAHTGSSTLSTR